MEILNSFALGNFNGGLHVLRVLHVLCGIVWMGAVLNSFLVSTTFTEELQNKNNLKKLQDRITVTAISATAALASGVLYLAGTYSFSFYSSWGLSILMGSGLGTVMWVNYIFIIWPNQKVAIHLTKKDNFGDPVKLQLMARFVNLNLVLSLPMIFFMSAASHLAVDVNAKSSGLPLLITFFGAVFGLEIYTYVGNGAYFNNRRKVAVAGLLLLLLLYLALETFSK